MRSHRDGVIELRQCRPRVSQPRPIFCKTTACTLKDNLENLSHLRKTPFIRSFVVGFCVQKTNDYKLLN